MAAFTLFSMCVLYLFFFFFKAGGRASLTAKSAHTTQCWISAGRRWFLFVLMFAQQRYTICFLSPFSAGCWEKKSIHRGGSFLLICFLPLLLFLLNKQTQTLTHGATQIRTDECDDVMMARFACSPPGCCSPNGEVVLSITKGCVAPLVVKVKPKGCAYCCCCFCFCCCCWCYSRWRWSPGWLHTSRGVGVLNSQDDFDCMVGWQKHATTHAPPLTTPPRWRSK